MRILTMLFITAMIGFAGMGAWIVFGPKMPSMFTSGDTPDGTTGLKRDTRRSAPYLILVPAKTLPDKIASAPPAPAKPPEAKPGMRKEAAPEPEKPARAKRPAPPPAALPKPEAKPSPIAKQVLEAVTEQQPEPIAGTGAKPQPAPKPVIAAKPEPAPKPVIAAKQAPAPEPAITAKPEPAPPQPRSLAKADSPPAKQVQAGPKPEPAPAVTPEDKPVRKKTESAAVQTPAKSDTERAEQLRLKYEVETGQQAKKQEKQRALLAKETVRFRRVVPVGTGKLKAKDRTIILAGIDSLDPDTKCTYTTGKSWDCGRWGTFSLRRFIRGRSVVCDLVDVASETEVTGRCEVAGVDINKWVVRRGWGKPDEDTGQTYSSALAAAKKEKLGRWSEAP